MELNFIKNKKQLKVNIKLKLSEDFDSIKDKK
jgi:hypothetical protein